MGKKPSLIEMNGQLYDANSGRLFHHPRGPVIDGFMKKPQLGRVFKKAAETPTSTTAKYISGEPRQHKPAQTIHQRTQHSNTLMRSVVKRPSGNQALGHKLKPSKVRTGQPSPARISRALNMMKNSRVERFGLASGHAKAIVSQTASRAKIVAGNGAGSAKATSSTAVANRPTPSVVASVSHQRLERMLDEALIRADAHKKALKGRLSHKGRLSRRFRFLPRWLTISIVALVVLSFGGYFAWRNIPYVSMKFASVRAQVKGSLPDYVPSGFKFDGPTRYESGSISMTFRADEESRYFTLTQKASSWDSSSLEANTLSDDAQVQTSQVKGTTVYYSGDQASWVNNGKQYIIKDHAQLNPDELFKIADSIL